MQVTVALRDPNGALIATLTGQIDPDGACRPEGIKGLVSGDDTAEVVDLAVESFSWDPTWKMNNSCRLDDATALAIGASSGPLSTA